MIKVEGGIPTGKANNCNYHEANWHVMKIRHNPYGSSAAEVMRLRHHILYDVVTGEIIGSHSGFLLAAELGETKPISAKTKDGVDAECLEVPSVPADFVVDGKFAYKVKNGKLVKG